MRWRCSSHAHPRPQTAGSNVQIRFSGVLNLSLCPASFLAGYNHCHLNVPVAYSLPAPPIHLASTSSLSSSCLLPTRPPRPTSSAQPMAFLRNTLLNVFVQDQLSLQLHISSFTQPTTTSVNTRICCWAHQYPGLGTYLLRIFLNCTPPWLIKGSLLVLAEMTLQEAHSTHPGWSGVLPECPQSVPVLNPQS